MNVMINGKEYQVTKAYNGKRGCMCGCRGDYVEVEGPAMAARVRKVQSYVGPMRPNSCDAASYSVTAFCGEGYVSVDNGGRTTAVYFKLEN